VHFRETRSTTLTHLFRELTHRLLRNDAPLSTCDGSFGIIDGE
jgi:hypothetical protein